MSLSITLPVKLREKRLQNDVGGGKRYGTERKYGPGAGMELSGIRRTKQSWSGWPHGESVRRVQAQS